MVLDVILRDRDIVNHPVIGFLRSVAKGEDAVLVEDQALNRRVLFEHFGGRLGEREAGHDIGHKAHFLAEEFCAHLLALGLIRNGENSRRMCVVDELVREEGMQ